VLARDVNGTTRRGRRRYPDRLPRLDNNARHDMKPQLIVAFGVAFGLALPPAAAQTADFLTVAKIACAPDRITRCSAPDKCESKDASPQDKAELLVIDFAAKKAAVRKSGETKPFGDVVDEKVSGDIRSFSVKAGGGSESLAITLTKEGKLTLLLDGDKHRAEATCAAES